MIDKQLQAKIDYSINLIRRAEPTALRYRAEGFFVAFSGGKDSQVLLKLTELASVKFTAEYRLTTIDPPENVRFIKEHYPSVVIVRPVESFAIVCACPTIETRAKKHHARQLDWQSSWHNDPRA